MRTALIAVLVLTAGSPVAANDDLTTEEIARKEGFSCGGEFVTMLMKAIPSVQGRVITIRRSNVIQVGSWVGEGDRSSSVWVRGAGISVGEELSIRGMRISLATATMLRKCLEDG